MNGLNGFLITQRQVTLEDVMLVCNGRKLHQPRMSDAFIANSADTFSASLVLQHMCCSVNCTII